MKRTKLVLLAHGLCLAQAAIADDSNWGCEVLLCLSNPNGPTAVGECRPPIRKLWRHLAKGRSFPTCTFTDSSGTASSRSNHARHTWASASNCAPGYVIRPDEGQAYCALAGSISVTVNDQLVRKVWWGKRGMPTDADQSVVEENFTAGSAKSDLQVDYEAALARKAEQDRLQQRFDH